VPKCAPTGAYFCRIWRARGVVRHRCHRRPTAGMPPCLTLGAGSWPTAANLRHSAVTLSLVRLRVSGWEVLR
jgi:hypothetical protein